MCWYIYRSPQWYSLTWLACTIFHIIYNTCKSVWKMLSACSSAACYNIFYHLSLLWHIWRGSDTDLASRYFGFSESVVLWFNDSKLNCYTFGKDENIHYVLYFSWLTQRMEVRVCVRFTQTILGYPRGKSRFFPGEMAWRACERLLMVLRDE